MAACARTPLVICFLAGAYRPLHFSVAGARVGILASRPHKRLGVPGELPILPRAESAEGGKRRRGAADASWVSEEGA